MEQGYLSEYLVLVRSRLCLLGSEFDHALCCNGYAAGP